VGKDQFLFRLKKALKSFPVEEQNDILNDYEEYFSNGVKDGKTEEEIAASLGSPEQLGKELTAMHHVENVEGRNTTSNFFRALWAVIGLGFFNLVIVLGPFLALASIIIAGWIVSITFVLAPVGVLINTVLYPEIFAAYNMFFSIGLTGLGLLIGISMYYVTIWMKNKFIQYFKFNVRMVKGGMNHV